MNTSDISSNYFTKVKNELEYLRVRLDSGFGEGHNFVEVISNTAYALALLNFKRRYCVDSKGKCVL